MGQNFYEILTKFINCFTEDEKLTADILLENYREIVTNINKSSFLEMFPQILQNARKAALHALKGKVFEGNCWTEKKQYFPISNAMTDMHKEIFCLRFYRGLSEQEIGDKLQLSKEQVHFYLVQVYRDISNQSITAIPDLLETP